MNIRATGKVFAIYQIEKVSIPPARGEILRLHYLSSRYSNGRKTNQDHT